MGCLAYAEDHLANTIAGMARGGSDRRMGLLTSLIGISLSSGMEALRAMSVDFHRHEVGARLSRGEADLSIDNGWRSHRTTDGEVALP